MLPTISFASSISTVLNMPFDKVIPEGRSYNPNDALDMGYAKSKWVAEALCDEAARQVDGLQVNIIRIGQLSTNTTTGIWNDAELWPLLLRGSQEIGSLANVPVSYFEIFSFCIFWAFKVR